MFTYLSKLFHFDSLKCPHITHFNTQCPPPLIFIYQIYFLIHPGAHSSITDLTTFCFYRNVTKKKKDVIYGSLNFLITLFFFAFSNWQRIPIPNSFYQLLQREFFSNLGQILFAFFFVAVVEQSNWLINSWKSVKTNFGIHFRI